MNAPCGDPFDVFVHSHEREVRAYLAGLGVPLHVVDDLAQDVFLDYYVQAEGSYDAGIAWLKGMARNKAREWFRRNGRQSRLYQRYADEIASSTSPIEAFSGRDGLLEQLIQCLDQLPEEQYRLIERYYGEEEDVPSIATSLGRSAAALRAKVHRLRDALRRCLHQRLQEEA